MFSSLFGKRDKSEAPPSKGATQTRISVPAAADKPAPVLAGLHNPGLHNPGISNLAPVAARIAASAAGGLDSESAAVSPSLVALELDLRKTAALESLEKRHERIANAIRSMWGHKECAVYINRLIMSGGDGMGQARVGFNQEVVDTLLSLSDIHDTQFGAPDTLSGSLEVKV